MRRIRKINRQKSLRPDTRTGERNHGTEEFHTDEILCPDKLCGTWESVNLNPSLIVYHDRGRTLLSVIHIAASGQASPSTYELECEEGVRFVRISGRRAQLSYDSLRDELSLEGYGTYMRNEP